MISNYFFYFQERRARFLAKEEQKKAKIQASRIADRERGGGNDSRSQRNEQKNKVWEIV